jgi:hypothetical protein
MNCRVFYYDGDIDSLREVNPPTGPTAPDEIYQPRMVDFEPILVYLPEEAPEIEDLALSEEQRSAYKTMRYKGWRDFLLGVPFSIQGCGMEEECHAASNGRSRDASEWKLLLQLTEDEEIGLRLGDLGTMYFWIREEDLARRDFDHVHVIVQSD